VAHERDLAPAELGGDAFGVPVRVQAHRDDHLLDPGGMLEHAASWSKPLRDECGQSAALVRLLPAPERHPAAGPELERRGQIVCASGPQDAGTLANHAEVAAGQLRSGRTTAPRSEESEPRSFLVRVPQPAALGVAKLLLVAEDLIHSRHASGAVSETTGNLT